MAKTIWTTKSRRPEDYVLAEEPDSKYPPAMKTQADALEKKILAGLASRKKAKR